MWDIGINRVWRQQSVLSLIGQFSSLNRRRDSSMKSCVVPPARSWLVDGQYKLIRSRKACHSSVSNHYQTRGYTIYRLPWLPSNCVHWLYYCSWRLLWLTLNRKYIPRLIHTYTCTYVPWCLQSFVSYCRLKRRSISELLDMENLGLVDNKQDPSIGRSLEHIIKRLSGFRQGGFKLSIGNSHRPPIA